MELQFGVLPRFVQLYVVVFLLHVVVLLLLLPRVLQVKLVQLFGVNVGVGVGHEGEDKADAQQEASKQQELYPLRTDYRLV